MDVQGSKIGPGWTVKILDHGYLRFVEDWGRGDAGEAEAGVIEAARQSTQGSFRGWAEGDQRLLGHLWNSKPKHATPFEFAGMTVEVQAPLFVFREWHRHRTMSYNEMSARYSPLPDLHYLPLPGRCLMVGREGDRQSGRLEGSPRPTKEGSDAWLAGLVDLQQRSEQLYRLGLSLGLPKELTRLAHLVNRYSRMRVSANLRNWLAFVTLRSDDKAQWEIRQYSLAVGDLLAARFPRTWGLYSREAALVTGHPYSQTERAGLTTRQPDPEVI